MKPYIVIINIEKQSIVYISEVCSEAVDDLVAYKTPSYKFIIAFDIQTIHKELYTE